MSATNKIVNVEIYADIICPWCYIGKKRLDAAFAARRHVTPRYIWRGFLLNPGMPAEGMDRQAYLHNKFGSAAAAVYGRIAAAGLDSGIAFNFDKITRTPDSRGVHHVLLSAQNNVEILSEAFYQAYFIEGKDIGDPDIIAAIIDEAGVDIDLDTVHSPQHSASLNKICLWRGNFSLTAFPVLFLPNNMLSPGRIYLNIFCL